MQKLDSKQKGGADLIALKLPPDLHQWIKGECERYGQSKSEYIRDCLEAQREK
jgi:predicted DNA-binding protein